jgi:predicted dehydrogenase
MAAELTAAVREGRPAAPDFHDGVRVQAVIDASLRSGRERRWVSIAEVDRALSSGSPTGKVEAECN